MRRNRKQLRCPDGMHLPNYSRTPSARHCYACWTWRTLYIMAVGCLSFCAPSSLPIIFFFRQIALWNAQRTINVDVPNTGINFTSVRNRLRCLMGLLCQIWTAYYFSPEVVTFNESKIAFLICQLCNKSRIRSLKKCFK